jgi:simple sugar transport system permease protein/ribose transport system permease protein
MNAVQSAQSSGVATTAPGFMSRLRDIIRAREFGIFAFLLLMIVILGILRPTFFTSNNVLNMGRQMAQLTVMAVAMTFLITAQELDLSVGSVFGLCSMMMALLARDYGVDLWLALLIVMGVAALIGLFNGLLVTYARIPSFIVTLGMLYIVRGATLMLSSYPVARLEHPSFFEVLAGDVFGNVPIQIFWMLAFVVVGYLVMQRTTFGYHIRATGSNRGAAELSGIRVRRVKIIGFMLTSMTAAFAGALSFAHLTSVAPTAGTGNELTVIAAVVIGGTALFGGYGTVLGTFLGAALLIVIRNGLVQLGGDGRLQDAFLGAIIIIAVAIHTYLELRRR